MIKYRDYKREFYIVSLRTFFLAVFGSFLGVFPMSGILAVITGWWIPYTPTTFVITAYILSVIIMFMGAVEDELKHEIEKTPTYYD